MPERSSTGQRAVTSAAWLLGLVWSGCFGLTATGLVLLVVQLITSPEPSSQVPTTLLVFWLSGAVVGIGIFVHVALRKRAR